jgi:hypothetical protein
MDEATRIKRGRRPPAPPPARRSTWTHRLPHPPRPRPEVVDRIALFTCALAGARAQELLGGLCAGNAPRAQAFAEQFSALDGAAKRARAVREFGERRDAADRVRALLGEAAALEGELASRIPRYLLPGGTLAHPAGPGASASAPARVALVERLVREAVR